MTNEMYNELYRMYTERITYYQRIGLFHEASAYESARDMLEYAHHDNHECLSQFDYFGDM